MNTENTSNGKNGTRGRRPDIYKLVTRFCDKHGPTGKYGMRFNSEKQLSNLDSAIAKLNELRSKVVIPPVVVPQVVTVVAPETTQTVPITTNSPAVEVANPANN
jgi:hypothetical protein